MPAPPDFHHLKTVDSCLKHSRRAPIQTPPGLPHSLQSSPVPSRPSRTTPAQPTCQNANQGPEFHHHRTCSICGKNQPKGSVWTPLGLPNCLQPHPAPSCPATNAHVSPMPPGRYNKQPRTNPGIRPQNSLKSTDLDPTGPDLRPSCNSMAVSSSPASPCQLMAKWHASISTCTSGHVPGYSSRIPSLFQPIEPF